MGEQSSSRGQAGATQVGYRLASDRIVAKVLDGEAIIIDLATGYYYGLDGVGAVVWQLAADGGHEAAIIGAVTERYSASDSAHSDVKRLLDELVSLGLLAVDEATGQNAADTSEHVIWPDTYNVPEAVTYDDVADMVALDPPLPELDATN